MRWVNRRFGPSVALLLTACGPAILPSAAAVVGRTAPSRLPVVGPLDGPLQLNVVYPGPLDQIEVRDSTFMFGSLGTGKAALTIDGIPITVWPNGAWLGWVPLPADADDTLATFVLTARTPRDSAILSYPVHRVPRFSPPRPGVWIDPTSFRPAGRVEWPATQWLPLSVRGVEGASLRLIINARDTVPLIPDPAPGEVPWGIRAFDRDTGNLAVRGQSDRYVGQIRGTAIADCPVPGGPDSAGARPATGCGGVTVEAILPGDTARVEWPLRVQLLDSVARMIVLNDDTAGRGSDSITVGRARPGATYHWFFPTGTRARMTGRLGDDLRLQLSSSQEAWVNAADAIPLPAGTPEVRATVGSVTVTPEADRLILRIPMTQRIAFRVEEEEHRLQLRFYDAVSDINWTRYGPTDPYLRQLRWRQETSDEVLLTMDLGGPVWGYRSRWDRADLVFDVRRPPPIDRGHPLRGRTIVVDPGHPPLGATGPTGLREAEANLAIALRLRDLLVAAGARVLLTRDSDRPLELWPRVRLADSVNADVLVSIHNNALPDGVNPFTNNGVSVFYNHPRSLPLARAIQAALVRRLGGRDLGAARGDLALTRPTWMPAVLTEGLFLMLPDQEAALRNPLGQDAYALAVRDGLTEYLRGVGNWRPSVP
jgi:N-acetylmuramoyl-L-alanine amidase